MAPFGFLHLLEEPLDYLCSKPVSISFHRPKNIIFAFKKSQTNKTQKQTPRQRPEIPHILHHQTVNNRPSVCTLPLWIESFTLFAYQVKCLQEGLSSNLGLFNIQFH